MGMITAVAATGLAGAMAFTPLAGTLTSAPPTPAASTPTASAPAMTLPAGGVLARRTAAFCHRLPHLQQRAEKAEARMPKTVERLKKRQAQATKNRHPKVARKLGREIERRERRLKRLPGVEKRLAQAATECKAL